MADSSTRTFINNHASILSGYTPRNTAHIPRNTGVWTKDEIADLVYYRDLYRHLSWGDFAKLGLFPGRTINAMQTLHSFARRVLGPTTPTQTQSPLYLAVPVTNAPSVYTSPDLHYPGPASNLGAYDGNTIVVSGGESEASFTPTPGPAFGPGAYEGNTILIKCDGESDARSPWKTNATNLSTGPVQFVMRPHDVPIPTIGESFPRDKDRDTDTHYSFNDCCARCEKCQECEYCKGRTEIRTSFVDIPDNFDTVRYNGWTAFRARPVPVTPDFEPSESPNDMDLILTPPDAFNVMDIDEARVQRIAQECMSTLASEVGRDEAEAAFDLLALGRSHENADMRF